MQSIITYFTGGASYSVPIDLSLTYVLTQLRFLFFGFVLSYYFAVPYTVITMAISVLLADMRFFLDFTEYMNSIMGDDSEKDL